MASKRKRNNQIQSLQDEGGNWVDWTNGLETVVSEYF